MFPIKTSIRGPAAPASPGIQKLYYILTNLMNVLCVADEDDIIDETLNFFRANVFFRNFDVRGPADRTMIYLTLYAHQCLVKCEKIEDRASGFVGYPC